MSFQSTLGEDEGIAEELAESQRAISIAEFFEKNKHMLGFDSGARALVTAVKEGVDNSLTWSTPFVYRRDGETRHEPIGSAVDRLIEHNEDDVVVKRDGDLEKLRVDDIEALSFDDTYDVDFQRVSSVFRHRVNSDIYRLTVEGGREVELTDYHSVFVLRDGEVVSVETSEITEDDYVILPDSEWGDGGTTEVDIVSELTDLPPEQTEDIGLHGVEHLIDGYYDEIRELVTAQYRMSDFRKCDRLPLDVVRSLPLDTEEYRGCELGVKFGRNNVPAVLSVDDHLAELLGLYAAEGCVTGGDHEKVYLSLGSHETELIEHAEALVRSTFGLKPSRVAAHESATNVAIHSKIAGLLFETVFDAGTGAPEKRIPRHVFDFDERRRERFFLGYAAGDGHPTTDVVDVLVGDGGIDDIDTGRVTLATASDRLSSGIRYLLSSVGFDATHEHVESDTREVDGREAEFGDSHLLYVRTDQSSVSRGRLPADETVTDVDDAKLAYNLDGRQSRVETDNAVALADGGALELIGDSRELIEGDLSALPVTDVERIDYDGEWVYDVSVPGDENFMAGTSPLACHNSLDACEEADLLPDIYVEIKESGDYYTLVIEDNGPGITEEQIPKVFGKLLYGSRFHKREQSLTPEQQLLVRRDGEVESIPIGMLCDAYLPESGEGTARIPADIEAPSFNRETHDVTWQPVTHAIRHETDERVYELTTEKGRTVEVTGNHSLFSVTAAGETREVSAGDLAPGDVVLAPQSLPSSEDSIENVNLLEHLAPSDIDDRRLYVYGFETETLEQLREGERVRKKPQPDSSRERTYYRYDGVDISKDSLETNYLDKGYLPADLVLELGWEGKAAEQGCVFTSYQVGGDETTMPVSLPVTGDLMKLLGYYVAEGHAGPRQVGFTFGSHESGLIEHTERALASVGSETTTVERERNSTRVKAFGSPLALFLERTCGSQARDKRIPSFVFEAAPEHQRAFVEALYQGDGSDTHPSNELSHTTTSETLARQLSVLWNMQGVLASTEVVADAGGYGDGETTQYRTKVYGDDVETLDAFEAGTDPGNQGYKRVPTTLLDEVRVGEVDRETVPDAVPGLLLGAGVGSSLEHAAVYESLIADALDGEYVEKPRYVHNLKEMGLLDEDHRPTPALEDLWDAVHGLQGLTETDMCLLPVKRIEETDPPEYVYDISVPGATGHDENFVVANEGALTVKNSRGQQGIGISAAVLYSQLTSGKPAKITSRTQGSEEAQYFELIVDTDDNEPEISESSTTAWDRPHGTRIELEMEGNMRARQQLHDYVKHTAVVNPHARIELREPSAEFKYERATDQLPAETEEIRPHPHGVELGTLIKMAEATDSYSISGFLQGEFTRVGGKTADSVIANFNDRHFGREMTWRPPQRHRDEGLEATVREAVANKGKEATADFAARVAEDLGGRDRVAHHQVVAAVAEAADAVAEAYDTTFGETVREKAVAAAWGAVTVERVPDVYALVDAATTDRKDDAAIQGLAERLAAKFEGSEGDDPDERRHRVTRDELVEYVRRAAEMTEEHDDATFGETARENVVDELWAACERVPDDPPRVHAVASDRDTASELLEAMRETDIIAPPTGCLAPITEELVEAGLRKEFDADFYAAATRDASVHGGDPFIVEAGLAYGGSVPDDGAAEVMRFANRVPLVYQRGACATTDVIKGINWRNYGLDQPGGSGLPNGPAVIMVHVASTNVPFTSESKDAVANVPEIEHEIELAVREAARELKSFLNKRRSMQQRREKQDKLATILPEMAEKLAEVTGRPALNIDDTMARIMNNVLVERERADGRVRLTVENNTDAGATLEVTDIVTAEPDLNGAAGDGDGDGADATVVEMDGEYFLKWEPHVPGGGEATLAYDLDDDAECDLSVEGIEDEKLTVDA